MPWRNAGVTTACPVCGTAFTPVGRLRVCSAACRQKAFRQRRPVSLPPLPTTRPKVATVYVCGTCEQRYLGEQWCSDCQRPCRRIGPGGACPHCDEPVALADLLTPSPATR